MLLHERDEVLERLGCVGERLHLLIGDLGEVGAEHCAGSGAEFRERDAAGFGQVDEDDAPVVRLTLSRAYTPFPLRLGIHQLGYTFACWGMMLAVCAVFVAPRIGRRFGDVRGLGASLSAIVAILLLIGILHASQTALIICVVASGAFLGITNTLMTQVVMESASVPRPIASSAYNMVRFCGGAIAPFVAGKLAEHVSIQAPFYLGAGMTAIGVGALWLHRDALVPAAREVNALVVPMARRRRGAVHVLRVDRGGRARR